MTTVQFWQQQLATEQAAQAAAQAGLRAAQDMQKDSTAKLGTSLAALDATAARIAARRAQLALTTIPAEAQALIDQITQDVIAQRALQGTMLDHKADLAEANAQAAVAAVVVARSAAQVAAAQAALAASGTDSKQREQLRTAIAAPPLQSIAADATALLASATAGPAQDRLDKNFPKSMQAIATERVKTCRDRLDSAQKAFVAAQEKQAAGLAADNGHSGAVQQAWLHLQQAQAALAWTVATAPSLYAKARTLLQRLEAIEAGTGPDILTQAEKAARAKLDPSDDATKDAVIALHSDLQAVFTKQGEVDDLVLDEIAAPGTTAIASKRAELVTDRNKLDTDLAAFTLTHRNKLDQWEAVIPDPAWNVLLDYLNGLEELKALAGTALPTLAKQMDDAEDNYTNALGSANAARRRADAYADEAALREARLAAAQAVIGTRLASAIRGDTY